MSDELPLPDSVRSKALALGQVGQQWLDALPELVSTLATEWDLSVGEMLQGGSAAYVAGVTTDAGTPAVLKLQLPGYDDIVAELGVLRIADGRGYARLLRTDHSRGALLIERLGPPLSELGFPIRQQIETICATLRSAWIDGPEVETFPTGAVKARWLRAFIIETWVVLDHPCSERVIDQAIDFCDARDAAFDPERAVLVHGDAHSGNVLAPLGVSAGALGESVPAGAFKLVDPDGLFAERAYDLGVLMRGWSAELLAGGAWRIGWERDALLSELTGEDPEAIWQWGFIERVSTGLLLMQTGQEREGRTFLDVAEAWASS